MYNQRIECHLSRFPMRARSIICGQSSKRRRAQSWRTAHKLRHTADPPHPENRQGMPILEENNGKTPGVKSLEARPLEPREHDEP